MLRQFLQGHHSGRDSDAVRMVIAAQQLLVADIAQSKVDRAVLLVTRRLTRLDLKVPKEPGRVCSQFRLGRAIAKLANDAGGVPGRATGNPAPFDQNGGHAAMGQMIKRGYTYDATADDDNWRSGWKLCCHVDPAFPVSGRTKAGIERRDDRFDFAFRND